MHLQHQLRDSSVSQHREGFDLSRMKGIRGHGENWRDTEGMADSGKPSHHATSFCLRDSVCLNRGAEPKPQKPRQETELDGQVASLVA